MPEPAPTRPLLRRELADGILTVTVDRPERRNALGRAGWLKLRDVVREVAQDGEIRGLVVTGAGNRAFVSGADVGELVDRPPEVALEGFVQRVLLELEDLPVPTVAALNGDAFGGGWELALACDFRVAAPHVRVGFPEVGLGIIPGAGGTQRLLQQLGLGRAKELVLTGRPVSAAEALQLGLVNRVVDGPDVLGAARELLERVLAHAPHAVRLAKAVLNATARGTGGWDLERLAYALSFCSEERRKRMRAFLEGRARTGARGADAPAGTIADERR
ncbi:MAG TPA: enoyl-CoA hydratase/isomerase family protein [Actinomycetota bacterium]|nr:enoyl-CoA hydratase/isomerase family protein [Actinomycetota bacterium]